MNTFIVFDLSGARLKMGAVRYIVKGQQFKWRFVDEAKDAGLKATKANLTTKGQSYLAAAFLQNSVRDVRHRPAPSLPRQS